MKNRRYRAFQETTSGYKENAPLTAEVQDMSKERWRRSVTIRQQYGIRSGNRPSRAHIGCKDHWRKDPGARKFASSLEKQY
ncbi:unnamed protein product [Toxocara canis]|uniref:Uncharacterized protein n=1 Tax=Toxocara canis TaxID=6265 RepID=A0A183UQS8_TOXCA|nr:unnamed protein product [Toxocara canis]